MTTFGNLSIGTSLEDVAGDFVQVSIYTLSDDMTVEKLHIYLDGNGSGTGNQALRGVIYENNINFPDALIAFTDEVVITEGQDAGWVTFPFSTPVDLTAADYHLGFIAETLPGNNSSRFGKTTHTPGRYFIADDYSDGPRDPFGGGGTDDFQISVYAESTVSLQTLAPSADSVDGAWTDQAGGTSLFAAIDEESFSDSDYIRSEVNPSASGCRVKLAAGGDPAVSTGHKIVWRTGKIGNGTINMTVKLYQGGGDAQGGGTLIASFSRNGVGQLRTFTETLSGAEADAITDYTDLYLEFFADEA